MLRSLIHRVERKKAREDLSVRVHPFDWGLEYLGVGNGTSPRAAMLDYARRMTGTPGELYPDPGPPSRVEVSDDGRVVRFPSAIHAPERETNTATLRLFLPERPTDRAMVVLPQWNADAASHVAVCRGFARRGIAAARLTLPYHEERGPEEGHRADLAVSANLGRTILAVRQAVSDARRARTWLESEGYGRVGLLGTSLGSCLAFLTLAAEPRFRLAVLHHVSSHFGEVVWRGISTRHVREELERAGLSREIVREVFAPISPIHFVPRVSPEAHSLLLIGRYDLTFPYDLSRRLHRAYGEHGRPHQAIYLPWGHYTSGFAPFAGFLLWRVVRYLNRRL